MSPFHSVHFCLNTGARGGVPLGAAYFARMMTRGLLSPARRTVRVRRSFPKTSSVWSADMDVVRTPSTAVMVSPATSPAFCAGDPASTWMTLIGYLSGFSTVKPVSMSEGAANRSALTNERANGLDVMQFPQGRGEEKRAR